MKTTAVFRIVAINCAGVTGVEEAAEPVRETRFALVVCAFVFPIVQQIHAEMTDAGIHAEVPWIPVACVTGMEPVVRIAPEYPMDRQWWMNVGSAVGPASSQEHVIVRETHWIAQGIAEEVRLQMHVEFVRDQEFLRGSATVRVMHSIAPMYAEGVPSSMIVASVTEEIAPRTVQEPAMEMRFWIHVVCVMVAMRQWIARGRATGMPPSICVVCVMGPMIASTARVFPTVEL